MTRRPILVAGVAIATLRCSGDGPTVCTASVEPAIVVEIRDARTGAPIAEGARGVVRDGAYVDSLAPYAFTGASPSTMYSRRAADERPGRYAVEIIHYPAYQTWTATDVRVERGECHVSTVTLQARLEPKP
jgi:hypothetical protein